MNKQEFLSNPEVIDFLSWGCASLPSLRVKLEVSKRGTGCAAGQCGPGISEETSSFSDLVRLYHWRSEWQREDSSKVFSDDWPSTQKSLLELAQWLRSEVSRGSQSGTLKAAKAIVIWGGDRSHLHSTPQGAIPFLEQTPDLPGYLQSSRSALALSQADTNFLGPVIKMNAMLTKVHSLLAEDGLPIYDSRVAGAIAFLVERYRRSLVRPWTQVPLCLKFKATDYNNSKRRMSGLGVLDKLDPGYINRQDVQACIADWVSAKIRLGWLAEELILQADKLGNPIIDHNLSREQSLQSRMRAFEAGLFMLGFDLSCLQDGIVSD